MTSADDSGVGSLRDAINQANGLPGLDTVLFESDLGVITLTSGEIVVSDSLEIRAPEPHQIIDGNSASRIFAVTDPLVTLQIENLHLRNARNLGSNVDGAWGCDSDQPYGGAICSMGDLELVDSVISGSSTTSNLGFGGAIHVLDAQLTLLNSSIVENWTEAEGGRGGGISVRYGQLVMTSSALLDNRTLAQNTQGGAAYVVSSDAVGTNVIISGNSTEGVFSLGGGFYGSNGQFQFTRAEVSGNRTLGNDSRGGGAAFAIANVSVVNSTISGNSAADGWGGGIYSGDGGLDLTNSTLVGNYSGLYGGGIAFFVFGSEAILNMDASIVAGNTGPGLSRSIETDNLGVGWGSEKANVVNARYSVFGDDATELRDINLNNQLTNVADIGPLRDMGCFETAGATGWDRCIRTHELSEFSVARDNGFNPTALETDQRGDGFPRLQGPAVDIGAFEFDPAVSTRIFQDRFEGKP